jgi:hypothetical protein
MEVRVQSHAARFDADGDFSELEATGDILPLGVAYADDGEAVRLAIDHEEPAVIGADSDSGRAARGGERGRIDAGGGADESSGG